MKKLKYFLGASILAAGLMVKAGAPIVPVAVGLGVAALLTWKKVARASQLPR
jgi:hypothetical protein